jgi:hypothetical protein
MGVMLNLDRLTLATKLVTARYDASLHNPSSWRRLSALSARTGIKGDQLDQAVADVVSAGLAERHADDAGLLILTNEGWAFARI